MQLYVTTDREERPDGIEPQRWVIPALALVILAGETAYLLAQRASTLSVTTLLALNMAIALLALVSARPRFLGYLVLVTSGIPLELLTGGERPFGGLNFSSLRLIGSVALLLGFVLLSKRAQRYALHFKTYLLFLAFGALSLAYAPDLFEGARFWFKLAYPFLVFLLLLSELRTMRQWLVARNLIWWSLALTLAVAMIYFQQAGRAFSVEKGIPRLNLSSPGGFAEYTALLTLAGLAHFLWLRRRFYLWLALLTGGLTVLTVARIVLFGLAITLLVLYYWRTRSLRIAILLLLAIGAGLLLYRPLWSYMFYVPMSPGEALNWAFTGRLGALLANVNTAGRANAWPQLITGLFLQNPLIGAGLGSCADFLRTRALAPGSTTILLSAVTSGFDFPHNEYIRFLCEVGLIGLGLLLLAYRQMCRILARVFRCATSPAAKAAAATAALSVLFLLITVLTTNSFNDYYQLTIYVLAWCALALRGSEIFPQPRHDERPTLSPNGDNLSREAQKT